MALSEPIAEAVASAPSMSRLTPIGIDPLEAPFETKPGCGAVSGLAPTKRGSGHTIRDVARLANVSIASVSRVVSGGAAVSDALRQRIEDAVRGLGYVPDPNARALVTRPSRCIRVESYVDDDLIAGPLIHALARECSAATPPVPLQVSVVRGGGGEDAVEGYQGSALRIILVSRPVHARARVGGKTASSVPNDVPLSRIAAKALLRANGEPTAAVRITVDEVTGVWNVT